MDKPQLSDHQLSELNDILVFKMFHDPQIEVSYFEGGYIRKISGYIHKVDTHEQSLHLKVDTHEQSLHLYEETGLIKIKLSEITEIK
ncbi:YolD-like family protein [Staphylococcus succinus]|uniref:YolD-like family protein n=1 Tax=Staphylococcus succinus TaxID=61015 RepID=UPI003B983EC2